METGTFTATKNYLSHFICISDSITLTSEEEELRGNLYIHSFIYLIQMIHICCYCSSDTVLHMCKGPPVRRDKQRICCVLLGNLEILLSHTHLNILIALEEFFRSTDQPAAVGAHI